MLDKATLRVLTVNYVMNQLNGQSSQMTYTASNYGTVPPIQVPADVVNSAQKD